MRSTLLLLALLACTGEPPSPTPPEPEPVVEPEPGVAWPAPKSVTDARYAASHILLAYDGALRAPEGTSRTADEAKAEALSLLTLLRDGADFAELAAEHSDGPSARRGGRIGTFLTGTMLPSFEQAVAGAEVGEYTLAETAYGWHVIRRDAVEHVRVQHIVVGYAGAHESTATRSEDEARALLVRAQERLAAGESFDALAAELNEDPSRASSGHLGGFGRGQMVPAFEEVAFGLAPGETSDIVRTPYGLHLVRRLE